jgi:hypothetical protein
MTKSDCPAVRRLYDDIITRHNILYTKYKDICQDLVKRAAANADSDVRKKLILALMDASERLLREYKDVVNEQLRFGRRQLKHYFKHCSAAPGDELRRLLELVNSVHGTCDGALRKLAQYMSEENKDDDDYTALILRISDVRERLDVQRNRYQQAFSALSLAGPLLFDAHSLVVLAVKVIKFGLTFMIWRISRQWFERDVANGTAPKDDVGAIVRRALVLLLAVDAAVIGFLFSLSKFMRAFASVNSVVWRSLAVDCLLSDAVTLLLAAVLARVFTRKKYFRLREDRAGSISVFVDVVTYVSGVNAVVPYFLML